jgi:recombination protein RecT
MCRRTVVNRLCKYIISSSSDASIVAQTLEETEMMSAEAELDAGLESEANAIPIDITPDEVPVDAAMEPVEPADSPFDEYQDSDA